MIEALTPERADEPFRKRILPRTARRRENFRDAHALDTMAERLAEDAVAIAGADFFTSEVWTPRGLITYYTLFVIDLRSRKVHVASATPNPDAWFMAQVARRLTDAVDGFLAHHRVFICDRDAKWTDGFRRIVQDAGVRIVLTPIQAPNANAYAERFVRSIREECLDRRVPRMPNREGRQCCGRDEGRPLGVGVQDQASNPLTLRWSRASVVNGEEKAR